MLNGFALISLKTCHSYPRLIVTLHNTRVTHMAPASPRACILFSFLFFIRARLLVIATLKVAAVIQEDHCPVLCSFYFILRRSGLGNAFQKCYITAVTGTDVDLSSV